MRCRVKSPIAVDLGTGDQVAASVRALSRWMGWSGSGTDAVGSVTKDKLHSVSVELSENRDTENGDGE